uniref:Uncharacterized protein n=1 Tax=uncultured bacterium contig00048 TaxID=1181533 RepID=A0A806K244_9BACT|nr:hypothetical protein [uncultured bacterium contig00048]
MAAVFFAATAICAQNIVAVLEIVPSSGESSLTIQEFRHLTDELRTQARATLPQSGYTILTRDNIIQLLPPDEAEAQCLAESCAVDIGRAIGAEYVTQGFVGKFENKLTLTVELYESMSGNLLGSFVTESETAGGLLGTIREKGPILFAAIKPPSEPGFSGLPAFGGSPTNDERRVLKDLQDNPQSQRTSLWIAIGLDVLGAAAIGFGVWQNSESNKLHRDYRALSGDADYEGAQEKVESTTTKRNVAYIIGGALLAAGIGVHVWF